MYSVWALVVKVGWFLVIVLDMGFKVHICAVSAGKASGLSMQNEILFPSADNLMILALFANTECHKSSRTFKNYKDEKRS